MTRYLGVIFLFFFFSCFPVNIVIAQQAEIATLRWPPFRMVDASGQLYGLDVDIMKAVGAEMAIDFKFQEYPWPRCLKYMQNGRTDFMTGIAKSPDREVYIQYAASPYFRCSPRFYAKLGSGIQVESYDDLYGKSIGTCRDSKYFERFDNDMSLQKHEQINEEVMLRMLTKGYIDLIIGTDCQVRYDLNRLNLQNKIEEMKYSPDSPVNLYVGVSKKSPYAERIDELSAVIEKLQRAGAIDELAKKYFSKMAH